MRGASDSFFFFFIITSSRSFHVVCSYSLPTVGNLRVHFAFVFLASTDMVFCVVRVFTLKTRFFAAMFLQREETTQRRPEFACILVFLFCLLGGRKEGQNV